MRNPFPHALAALLLTLLVGCNPAGDPLAEFRSPQGRPNVLLITLDTTRADSLGCYGNSAAVTPHLDALARTGLLFEHAYTPVPITLPAHASIHTGVTPPRHGIRVNASFDLDPDLPTLAETLRGAGYRTGAVVGAFPLIARFHLDRGFDPYDADFPYRGPVRHPERPATQVVDAGLEWLDGLDGASPWFLWTHFFDPHDPYEPPPPFARGSLKERYAGEIAYVDQQVGRLLASLESRGVRERTVVIVVGDHGESLGDHGEKKHSYFIYDATVRIPLILSIPGITPGRETTPVSTIDVMPTIVGGILGLESPGEVAVSPRGLLPDRGLAPRPISCETILPSLEYGFAPLFSIRSGEWKYIHAPRPELYHSSDPGEEKNVARENPAVVEGLRSRLEELLATAVPAPPDAEADDPALRARLASLGYARFGAPLPLTDGAARRDPKDTLDLYLTLRQAATLGKIGRLREAIERLEALESEFAGTLVYHVELGGLLFQESLRASAGGQEARAAVLRARAKTHFLEVLEDHPDYVNALLNVGNLEYAEGEHARARPHFERVVAVDPAKWEAYVPLAVSRLKTGVPPADVLSLLRSALELDLPPVEEKRVRALITTVERLATGSPTP